MWTSDPDDILDPIKLIGFMPSSERPDTLGRARKWREARIKIKPEEAELLFIVEVTRRIVQ